MNSNAAEALARWREENPDGAKPRNPVQRWKDKDTRKSAVDAFCWQCMGGSREAADGAMAAIKDCPSGPNSTNPCPLHAWRPYQP